MSERSLAGGIAQACGVLSAVIGTAALLGWIFHLRLLASFGSAVPMAPSTAVLFLLFGVAVAMRARNSWSRLANLIVTCLGGLGLLLALLLLLLSFLGIRSNAEHLGIAIRGSVEGVPLGYMSPLTAACFAVAGISFLAAPTASSARGSRKRAALGFGAACPVVLAGLLLLTAYLSGAPLLYGGSTIPPALSTALAFIVLGVSLCALSADRAWADGAMVAAADRRPLAILLLAVLALALGIVSAGYFYFQRQVRNFRQEVERQLSAIAELKVAELAQWRSQRMGDAFLFFANQNFSGLVMRFLDSTRDVDARRRLETWVSRLQLAYSYDRIALYDAGGEGRLTTPARSRAPGLLSPEWVMALQRSRRITFQDFYRDPQDQRIYLALLVPILDPAWRLRGILELRIDPEQYLYPLLNRWPGPSRTAETLIVRREGSEALFLNDLRFQKGAALRLRIPLSDVRAPAARAASGEAGLLEGIDYRGRPVLAAARPVPDSPWHLVARMDFSEVYAPLRRSSRVLIVLVASLLAGAGAAAAWSWRQRRLRYYQERYKAAEALRASEARYHRALDGMLEGCQILGFDWRYIYVNDAAVGHNRQSREGLLGRTIMERYPGIEDTPVFAKLQRCMEQRSAQTMESHFTFPDGTTGWFDFSIQPVPEGIFILSIDISRRKAAELELLESMQRLREAQEGLARRSRWILALNSVASEIARRNSLESILQVVMHYLEEHFPFQVGGIGLRNPEDGSSTVVTISARGRSLAEPLGVGQGSRIPQCLGLRPDGGIEQGPLMIVLGEVNAASLAEPGVEMLSRLRKAGLKTAVMLPLSADPVKIGGVFMLYRKAVVIGDSEREFLRGMAEYASLAVQNCKVYSELEQSYALLKKTQAAMMEQERLKAMGQMASGIAHDINNTLAPIALYAEALAGSELGRAQPASRYLRTIQEAVTDIEQITMRLRSFYKGGQEEGELQAIDLKELLASVAELTRPRWKDMPNRQGLEIRLETETETKLPPLVGNATEVREALINLIFNAVDAMPAGGVITLKARKTAGRLLLEVIDTGTGMNEGLRQRCLEPFFTTKGAEGSGLGLSVAYGTMQRHHGEIEVESEEGQGTTIRLAFPILPGQPRESPTELGGSDVVLPRLRILCVDDDPAVRAVLAEILAQSGQEVESRGSGAEALAALLGAKAEGRGFDLVITDLGMPHMDGKELARRIKSSSPGTPVILLSGWGNFLEPNQESDLEVDCVLSKPPTIAGLRQAIRKVLPPLDPAGGTA